MSASVATAAARGAVTRMSCAEATLRSLADAGVDTFFNIPGRGIYPLLNELPKVPELRYVTALHEFPLAAMADGFARSGGGPAFLNLYMSTGVLNAGSALFLAQRDRVPMVVTATQAESWAVGADHRAEVADIVQSVRPFTKWAWMPPTPDRVPEALRRAYAIAMTPPMGPVFVAIPVDYWGAEVEYAAPPPLLREDPAIAAGDPAVERIADLLAAADAPVLVVGYDAVREGGSPAAQRLAERLGCALVAEPEPATLPAPSRHPLFAGSVAEAVDVIHEADVVVHVAANTYEAFHAQIFDAGVPKTHVWLGSDGLEINKVISVSELLWGAPRPLLEALASAVERRVTDGATAARRAHVGALIEAERAPLQAAREEAWDAAPMSVARAVSELRDALPPETIVLDHSTTAVRLVRENFPVPDGAQYVSASGSCQGWGIGAAVGVQLANPDVPVVGIVGDGGFMFGLQAVWSAAQYDVPLLAVVLNNGGWSSMRASLARNSPAVVEAGMDLHFGWPTDYGRLASELGADGVRVETPQQLRDVLRERLPLSRPLVLDVVCRREPKTSASPFVGY